MSLTRAEPVETRAAPGALGLVLAHQLVGVGLAVAECAGRAVTDVEILRETYRQSFTILCSAGTLLGLGVATLAALRRALRLPAPAFHGALIGVAAYAFGTSLFSGSWISRQWIAPHGPALLACAALFVGWIGARLAQRSRARRTWGWPVTLAAFGTALAITDARVLPDLYPFLHVALLLGAWLALAAALIEAPWRPPAWIELRRVVWLSVVVLAASVPLSWWKSPALTHRLQWEHSPGFASRVYEQARRARWRLEARQIASRFAPAVRAWLLADSTLKDVGYPAAAAAWNAVASHPSKAAAGSSAQDALRPHIVLITVDALRADVAGLGPNWSKLAARGLAFQRAYAHASSTHLSLQALVSGRYDSRHVDDEDVIGALRSAAYDTLFVSDAWVTGWLRYHDQTWFSRLGRAEGIETATGRNSSSAVSHRTLDLLKNHAPTRPMFAWVHFFDLHEWSKHPGYEGTARERYESVWRAQDEAVGAFVRAAESILRDRPTVFVLTSDHGEYLGEAGRFAHTTWVGLPVTHVPLVVIAPGRAPEVSARPVGHFDVAATIAEVAGLTDFECDAVSLLRSDVDPERPLLMGDASEIAVVRGVHRLALAPFLGTLSLFDDAVIERPRRLQPQDVPDFERALLLPLLGSPMGASGSSPLEDP